MKSVLQDWVMTLPMMQQAVLCSALRGPDGVSKLSNVKVPLRFFRGVILNPADPELIEQGRLDVFMTFNLGYYDPDEGTGYVKDGVAFSRFQAICAEFLSDLDQYNIHFLTHFMHAIEIVGYKYGRGKLVGGPELQIREQWNWLYAELCRALHVYPESIDQLNERLHH